MSDRPPPPTGKRREGLLKLARLDPATRRRVAQLILKQRGILFVPLTPEQRAEFDEEESRLYSGPSDRRV